MLRWYLSPSPHFFSDWLWPYCASSCNCAISSQLNYGVSTYSADSIKHPIANFSLLKNLISIPYIAIILKRWDIQGCRRLICRSGNCPSRFCSSVDPIAKSFYYVRQLWMVNNYFKVGQIILFTYSLWWKPKSISKMQSLLKKGGIVFSMGFYADISWESRCSSDTLGLFVLRLFKYQPDEVMNLGNCYFFWY